MARGGHNAKPLAQRRAEGNPGKRPLPEPVILGGQIAKGDRVEPPDYLAAEAKAAWRQLVPQLTDAGMLDWVDLFSLEAISCTIARWREAERIIADPRRHYHTNDKGEIKPHPALRIARESQDAYRRFAEKFGLSPGDRARMGLKAAKGASVADEMNRALGGLPGVIDVSGEDA